MIKMLKDWLIMIVSFPIALYFAYKIGKIRELDRAYADEMERAYDAERVRSAIDDDIREDDGLADRARNAGIVRD